MLQHSNDRRLQLRRSDPLLADKLLGLSHSMLRHVTKRDLFDIIDGY